MGDVELDWLCQVVALHCPAFFIHPSGWAAVCRAHPCMLYSTASGCALTRATLRPLCCLCRSLHALQCRVVFGALRAAAGCHRCRRCLVQGPAGTWQRNGTAAAGGAAAAGVTWHQDVAALGSCSPHRHAAGKSRYVWPRYVWLVCTTFMRAFMHLQLNLRGPCLPT